MRIANLPFVVPIEGMLLTLDAALFVSVTQLLVLLDVDEFDAAPPVVPGSEVSTFMMTNFTRKISYKALRARVDL